MKLVVTGSLGHISRPLTTQLIEEGHRVTVISSNADRKQDIEKLGAVAAIGSLENVDFVSETFTGADAVYCMVPPNDYFDHSLDLLAYYCKLGNNYAAAIKAAGVKRVVNLSTFGADLVKGSGILIGAHNVEQILNELQNVSITHMRPASFYYNLYGYVPMIKNAGLIAANYGGSDIIPWVSPIDIAAAVADEIVQLQGNTNVRYVVSEELSCNDAAEILGAAIGVPDLKWETISNEQTLKGMKAIGMNPTIAAGLTEMYGSLHNGVLAKDYNRNKPAVFGKVKMSDFAAEFAIAFKQNEQA